MDGVYSFQGSIQLSGIERGASAMFKNGTLLNRTSWFNSHDGVDTESLPIVMTVELKAGDYVNAACYIYDSGSIAGGVGWSYFSGHLVGTI